MAKIKSHFSCQSCGYQSTKWMGRCPECGGWNTIVVDSIQTIYTTQLQSAPGSISQVREVSFQLMQISKKIGIATFLIGHVTKDGAIAGPRVLEHMVDTVLYFEGDRGH